MKPINATGRLATVTRTVSQRSTTRLGQWNQCQSWMSLNTQVKTSRTHHQTVLFCLHFFIFLTLNNAAKSTALVFRKTKSCSTPRASGLPISPLRLNLRRPVSGTFNACWAPPRQTNNRRDWVWIPLAGFPWVLA